MTTIIKKNFDEQLADYVHGKPLTEYVTELRDAPGSDLKQEVITGEIKITMAIIACRTCMNKVPGDDQLAGEKFAAVFDLGIKCARGGIIDLTVDEATTLKERVRKVYPAPMISNQLIRFIDEGAPKKKAK